MTRTPWVPTPDNSKVLDRVSVLYGDAAGGLLAEHSHDDVQVSVHFACRSQFRAEPQHVHIYPSQRPHAGGWRPGTEVIVFHLATVLLAEVRQELSCGTQVELVPSRGSRDPVAEGLGLLARDEYQNRNLLSHLAFESAGYMLARHLLRRHAAFPMPQPRTYTLSDPEFEALRRFVLDRLHCGFSVRELAAAIHVGPAILAQKLRGSVGLSPWRFVQEERTRRARELLRESRSPIAEVAAQLGYTDQSHFTTSFRRATGLTPKLYRAGESRGRLNADSGEVFPEHDK